MMMSASGPRFSVKTYLLESFGFSIQLLPGTLPQNSGAQLITRFTVRALHQLIDAADRNYGDDEEQGDETHALLHDEVRHSAALTATHLLRRGLRAPGE